MNPSKSELDGADVCLKVDYAYVQYHSPFLLEPTHMQCGEPAGALEVSSPTQPDEEYLSPQGEAMELGESPALCKRVHFKEPPSFQVARHDLSKYYGNHHMAKCSN